MEYYLRENNNFNKSHKHFLLFGLGICLNHADITKDLVECVPEKGLMGKAFKGAAKGVMEHLAKLSSEEVIALEEKMNSDG